MTVPDRYRLWWIPQIPGKPFEVKSDDLARLRWLENVLADYDLFQYENRIKPDYANAGGVQVFEDGEWTEIEDDE